MNRFHILTLFPEMVMDGLNTSIIGRAIEAGLLEINAVNIRDYSTNKHMKVDDYPYGGGAGLVMQPEPVYRAYKDLEKDMKKKPRVVYLTPQGTTFHQEMAKELAKEEELVFLCGHYEGIDERDWFQVFYIMMIPLGMNLSKMGCLNIHSIQDHQCF